MTYRFESEIGPQGMRPDHFPEVCSRCPHIRGRQDAAEARERLSVGREYVRSEVSISVRSNRHDVLCIRTGEGDGVGTVRMKSVTHVQHKIHPTHATWPEESEHPIEIDQEVACPGLESESQSNDESIQISE